jgi:hypothetical protein
MSRLLTGVALLAALAAPAAADPGTGTAEEIQVSVAGGDGTLRAQAERALAPYVRGPAGRRVTRRSTDELVEAVTDAIFGPQAARPGDFTPSAQNRQSVIETVREYVEAGKPIEGVTFWVGRKNYGVAGSGEPDLGDALAIRRYEAINQAVKAAGYAPGIKARIVLEDLGQLVMGGNTASVRRGISTYEKGMGRLIDVIGPNVSYELESSIISRRPVPEHVGRLLGLEPGTRGSSKVFLRLAALIEDRAFAYLQASARIAPATAADEAGLARVSGLPELHALEATGFKGTLPLDMRAAITRSTLERIGNPKGLSPTELDRAIARDLSQSFSRALMGLRSGSTEVDGRTLAPLTFSWVPYPKGSPPSLDVRRIEWTPNNQKGKGSPPPWASSAVFAPRGKRITTAMDAYSVRGRTKSSVPLEVTFKRRGKSVTVRSEFRRQRAAAPRSMEAASPLEIDVKIGSPVRGARFATGPGEIRRALKSYLDRPVRPVGRPPSGEALVDAVVEALFGPVADRPGASPPENRASVVATVREFIRAGKPIEGVTYWDGARLGRRTPAKAELVDALAIARLAELDARVKAAGYAPGVKVRIVLEDLGRRVMSGDTRRVRSRVTTYSRGLQKLIKVVGPNVVLEPESVLVTRPMPERATRLLGLPPGAAGTEKEYFRLTRIIERKLYAYLIESEGREPAHPDDRRGFARVRKLRTYAALEAIGFKGGLPTTQRAALRQRTRERNSDPRLGGRELDVQVARYLAQGFARTMLDARRGATTGHDGAPIAPLALSLLPHPPGSPPELYRRRIELKTIRGKRAPSTRPWLANGVFAPRGGRIAVTSDPVSRHGQAKQRQPVHITLRRNGEQITVRGDLRRLRAGRGAARRSMTARFRARH